MILRAIFNAVKELQDIPVPYGIIAGIALFVALQDPGILENGKML